MRPPRRYRHQYPDNYRNFLELVELWARCSSPSSSGSSVSMATGTPVDAAKRWPSGTSTPSGVEPESSEATPRWGQRRAPEPNVEPSVSQQPELLGHPSFNLVDLEAGVPSADCPQDLRHRVVAGVHDAHP